MRRQSGRGVTLIEVLVALAVFGVVMAIAYGAITGSLRIQSDQEAATTTQGKLRRIVEVITQDLRSSVFGSITDAPYSSNENQVSFMMLTGGAGYTVVQPGFLDDFRTDKHIDVQMEDATHLEGRDIVMIESTTRQGVVLPITRARLEAPGIWRLESDCRNTIGYNLHTTLIFEVETIGLRFDEATDSIRTNSASGDEAAFAFGINDFRIDYVYMSGDELDVRSEPFKVDGVPRRSFEDSGDTFVLQRVQFVVAAEAESRSRTTEHAYTGQVELSSNEHFTVEEILPCVR